MIVIYYFILLLLTLIFNVSGDEYRRYFDVYPNDPPTIITYRNHPKEVYGIYGTIGSTVTVTCDVTLNSNDCDNYNMTFTVFGDETQQENITCISDNNFTWNNNFAVFFNFSGNANDNFRCEASVAMNNNGAVPHFLTDSYTDPNSAEIFNKQNIAEATTCPCSVTDDGVKARIIGGTETDVNAYPWMAEILMKKQNDYEHFCGGTIITEKHILTAAHCKLMFEDDWSDVIIRIGEHDTTTTDESVSQEFHVSDVILHPDYDGFQPNGLHVYDIAIYVLNGTIDFFGNVLVSRVCLPKAGQSWNDEYLKAIGWGRTEESIFSYSTTLQEVYVKVLPNNDCDLFNSAATSDAIDKRLCTYNNKKDTCNGDSGGPLHYIDEKTKRHIQVALTSLGLRCGGYFPAIVTNVSKFLTWIRTTVQSANSNYDICTPV